MHFLFVQLTVSQLSCSVHVKMRNRHLFYVCFLYPGAQLPFLLFKINYRNFFTDYNDKLLSSIVLLLLLLKQGQQGPQNPPSKQ